MDGYSIGFAGSKDNGSNDALGSSDGVTISGVPGQTNAKTTVQLAADYGDTAELHIFMAARADSDSSDCRCCGDKHQPLCFTIGGTSAQTTLDFVDGNTYVFDISGLTGKSLTVSTTEDDLNGELTSAITEAAGTSYICAQHRCSCSICCRSGSGG